MPEMVRNLEEGKEDKKDAVSLFLKMVVLTASHLFPPPRILTAEKRGEKW